MSLKDPCTCGCERDSHYKDLGSGKLYNCLVPRCDCQVFTKPTLERKSVLRDIDGPETPRTRQGKPHDNVHCKCLDCLRWLGWM